MDDKSLFNLKYLLARNLLKRKIEKKKIDDLLIFLHQYVRFADSEYSIKFDQVIGELTENKKNMGIREMVLDRAKREEREENKFSFVKNLLLAGRFTVQEIASFVEVPENFVLEVMKSLRM